MQFPGAKYVGDFVNDESYVTIGNHIEFEVPLWRVTMDIIFHDSGTFQRFFNVNTKNGDAANEEGIRIGKYTTGEIEVVTGTDGAGKADTVTSNQLSYNTRYLLRIERTGITTDIFINEVEANYSGQESHTAMGWGSGITRFGLENSDFSHGFDGVLYSFDYEEINGAGVVQKELIKFRPVANNGFKTSLTFNVNFSISSISSSLAQPKVRI